jgi:hypothetical protein
LSTPREGTMLTRAVSRGVHELAWKSMARLLELLIEIDQ